MSTVTPCALKRGVFYEDTEGIPMDRYRMLGRLDGSVGRCTIKRNPEAEHEAEAHNQAAITLRQILFQLTDLCRGTGR